MLLWWMENQNVAFFDRLEYTSYHVHMQILIHIVYSKLAVIIIYHNFPYHNLFRLYVPVIITSSTVMVIFTAIIFITIVIFHSSNYFFLTIIIYLFPKHRHIYFYFSNIQNQAYDELKTDLFFFYRHERPATHRANNT